MYRLPLDALRFEVKNSILYKIDPRAKLTVSTIYALYTALTNNIYIHLILLGYLFIHLTVLGKIFRKTLRNIVILLPLVIIVFLANYIVTFSITSSLIPAIKLVNIVLSLNIFFLTTSPDDFSMTLEKLGFPITITLALSLSIRYIYVLSKTLQEIIDAQLSRGHKLDTGSLVQRIKNYIPIVVPLLIISVRKSILVAETLESRGFNEKIKRTPMITLTFTYIDSTYLLSSILSLILIHWITNYMVTFLA